MKPISDMPTHPKINTSDSQGYSAFSNFLYSNEDGTSSRSMVMDEVVRQNDPVFKSVLHNMREGTMDERSTDFLLKRCIYNLYLEEQEIFESTAIYLMPTWYQPGESYSNI